MICLISDRVEKEIVIGDFIETSLFSSQAFQLYEVIAVDEEGQSSTIMVNSEEVILSCSFISNVWRKV